MTVGRVAVALVLALAALGLRAQPPPPSASPALHEQRERLAALVAAACTPDLSSERQAARDVLFREIRPQLAAEGAPPSPRDAEGLLQAISGLPCASGRPRLERAFVHGELAYVVAAGQAGGGCSYLLRRDGERWVELLPCGWSLRS